MKDIFCSRNLDYKKPFGSVEIGTSVDFTVRLPLDYSFSEVVLCFYDGINYVEYIVMVYEKTEDDTLIYTASYTPKNAGVYFYYFRVVCQNQTSYI